MARPYQPSTAPNLPNQVARYHNMEIPEMIEILINQLEKNHVPFTWFAGALVFTQGNRAYAVTPTSDDSIIIASGTLTGDKK